MPECFQHRTTLDAAGRHRVAEAVDVVMRRPEMTRPVFVGIGGSLAYGLAHSRSDVDVRGVYASALDDLIGVEGPPTRVIDMNEPDGVLYEAGVFVRLVTATNPNLIELLGLDTYEYMTPAGRLLIDNRHLFFSQLARKTYGGFAKSQQKEIVKLRRRRDAGEDVSARARKHQKHSLRVLEQGLHLVRTGQLKVRVDDPAAVDRYSDLPDADADAMFAELADQLDTCPSVLPQEPDRTAINELFLRIRRITM
jgi:hypothetical protein